MVARKWLAVCVLLALVGCGQKAEQQSAAVAAAAAAPQQNEAPAGGDTASGTPRRHIAVRHALTLDVPAGQLAAAWQTAQSGCKAPACELLSAQLTRGDDDSPLGAQLSVRLSPAAFDRYLAALSGQSRVIAQSTQREDLTDQVIDVDAQIKNQTQLRDNLRRMLEARAADLEALLAVHQALAETQARLDAINGQRLALAHQTGTVALDIEWRSRRALAGHDLFSPLSQAWYDIGRDVIRSVATLLTFIAVALPWALLLWLPVRFLLRRRRRRRSDTPESP
ncbi:DUF4349 domain-containing protein [Chitiniphilus purpureus]|uniref:DUF4349 domain-containing protein n=1 Tax=Chitiniphilus purpureus TaxID=2981137 RepID=A0ABY6DHV2_9NEIS|nr:DUF4349 domain-containing protein [Chitiniphilus sp. CD1]UXY13927.1 DUF4349 domain-containing protein [Chitiniphilus sp. CD1]